MTASGIFTRSLAILLGFGAKASHSDGIAIGRLAKVDRLPPVPITNPPGGVAIGAQATVTSNWAQLANAELGVAIGRSATSNGGVAVGNRCNAQDIGGVAIGNGCTASTNAVALGYGSSAGQPRGVAIGESASTSAESVAIGRSTTASADGTALGKGANASASAAVALAAGTSSTRYGQVSHAGTNFSAAGDSQASRWVSRKITTDATPTELSLDNGGNFLTIPAARVMSLRLQVVARRTDTAGDNAAWPAITCGIARDATGNCRLLGTVTGAGTTTLCDAGASTWSVSVTADATNNRLAITVTGEAAKTIRWTALIDGAEVG